MAKGQVTEQDLEVGLKQAGGFGGLTKPRARRDSPFGAESAKPEPVKALQEEEKPVEMVPPSPEKVSPKPKPAKPEKVAVVAKVETDSRARLTKADIFSERITLNIAPETRDQAEILARRLQRKKTDKTERITANTLYRVAITALIEELDLLEDISPNTEEEMLEMVREKLSKL